MAEDMTEREFRTYIIKMIREASEEMKEQMQTLNAYTNWQLKEQIQEAKDHFNKQLEILKKNQTEILEMKETINQVKNSIESIIIKTIREANEEMKEQMQALKEEMKEQMQALNDHTNQQLKEQIQEARDHFNS